MNPGKLLLSAGLSVLLSGLVTFNLKAQTFEESRAAEKLRAKQEQKEKLGLTQEYWQQVLDGFKEMKDFDSKDQNNLKKLLSESTIKPVSETQEEVINDGKTIGLLSFVTSDMDDDGQPNVIHEENCSHYHKMIWKIKLKNFTLEHLRIIQMPPRFIPGMDKDGLGRTDEYTVTPGKEYKP